MGDDLDRLAAAGRDELARSRQHEADAARRAGDAPDDATLVDAFAALRRRRPKQKVSVDTRLDRKRVVIVIDSDEGSKHDGHRRWLVRWWREAARELLPALHRAYPLARVTFPG